MAKTLLCDCGAQVPAASAGGKIYCAQCGALLDYGDGSATMPEPPAPAARAARRRRKAARPVAAPAAADGTAVAGTTTFVPEPPAPGGRRRQRQRLPARADAQPPSHWLCAWIDPVTFFWLPVLVPPLAGGAGVMIVASQWISFRGIGVPFVFLGGFVVLVPLAFLLWHATLVMVAWGTGSRADPGWPSLDVVESYHNLVRWLCCIASTSLLVVAVRALGGRSGLIDAAVARWGFDLALGYLGSLHFLLTLLGASMWEDLHACTPWFALRTAWRLGWRLVPFACELLVGLCVMSGSLRAVAYVLAHDVALGILAWACWWTLLIFWLLRTTRALGAMCHRNQKRLGWFR